jgi:F-type H+-transporting ATPase subunit gamma
VGLVVITADRGLCGAFNSNIIKTTINHAHGHYGELSAGGNVKLFCIGRKGVDFFAKQNLPILGRYPGVFGRLTFMEAYKIALDIVTKYQQGEIDRVEVIYNEFKSIVRQKIVIEQYLPFEPEKVETQDDVKVVVPKVDYIYEPSRKAILAALVPKHLHFQLWRMLLESNASEQGARMTAMENATENANELIDTLQLQYNKARQAAITKELLEIVSGAEALRG